MVQALNTASIRIEFRTTGLLEQTEGTNFLITPLPSTDSFRRA
jgi:hypothetical protein